MKRLESDLQEMSNTDGKDDKQVLLQISYKLDKRNYRGCVFTNDEQDDVEMLLRLLHNRSNKMLCMCHICTINVKVEFFIIFLYVNLLLLPMDTVQKNQLLPNYVWPSIIHIIMKPLICHGIWCK